MLHRSRFFRPLFSFLLAASLVACHKHDDIKPGPTVLITSERTAGYSASELRLFLGLSGLNVPVSSLQYDADIYKVTYNTTYQGKMVTGSGLVVLPKTGAEVGMVSFQHGTIAAHADAPTEQASSSTELVLYAALTSTGFIAVVPDYLGFGSSAALVHPYYVREATSTTVIDLLIAAKELAAQKSVTFNGTLFLAGYSEGGYATMAAHRAIEQNGLEGFTLKASFPAAGGYDVKGMQEYLFGLDTYDEPFYLAYAAYAYKTYYAWTPPLSDLFQEPYAGLIPGLFDGTKGGSEINAHLTDSVALFIAPDFKAHINSDVKYQYVVDAFKSNSLLDWKPTIKMYLYHGDADTTVPYQNSVATYNQLIANGASSDILTLTLFPGRTHKTGIQPYIEDILPRILSLK